MMKSMIKYNIKDILNKVKWTQDLGKVEIWYIHRGAHNNTMIISGEDIVSIEKSFLETMTATIPYHRIFKIKYGDKTIFKRVNKA